MPRFALRTRQDLLQGAPTIVAHVDRIPRFLAVLADPISEPVGGVFVDGEVGWTDDDTVVERGAGDGDEFAVDFLGDERGGAGQGIAEAAAAPCDPFEDVAC